MSDKSFDQAYSELLQRLHSGANQSSAKIDIWAQYGETPWWNTMPAAAGAAPAASTEPVVTTELSAAGHNPVVEGQSIVSAHPDTTTSAFPEAANQPLTKSLAQLTVAAAPLGTEAVALVDYTANVAIDPGVFSRAVAHLTLASQAQGRNTLAKSQARARCSDCGSHMEGGKCAGLPWAREVAARGDKSCGCAGSDGGECSHGLDRSEATTILAKHEK